MQIRNRLQVPLPPADAWAFLMDIPATVPCFPGAEMLEKIDEENYRGRVTVKLGPLSMIFNGKLRIEDRDETAHAATVKATWTEAKGRGNATTVTRFAMAEEGEGTAIDITTDVQLAGQVAQYGRGVGMITDISTQLIAKFAENVRATIESGEAQRSDISGLKMIGRALANRVKSKPN